MPSLTLSSKHSKLQTSQLVHDLIVNLRHFLKQRETKFEKIKHGDADLYYQLLDEIYQHRNKLGQLEAAMDDFEIFEKTRLIRSMDHDQVPEKHARLGT